LSVRRQCELLGLNRSSWHYRPLGESAENLALMRRIDEQYLKTPCYGARKMGKACGIGRDRAGRLMRLMGLEAIYPKPRLSQNTTEHRIYPYLLRNVKVVRPNQVWASDITYVPMPQGWMYLTVVMDWFSRCVLSWRDRCNRRILCGVISWRRGLPRIHRNDTGCEDGEITRRGEGAVLAGSDSATGSQWPGNEAVLCPGRDSRTPVLLVAANLASAR
jgi:transposase InsO family protein